MPLSEKRESHKKRQVKESKRVRCSLEEKAVNNNHGAPNHGVYIESLVEMLVHTIMRVTPFIFIFSLNPTPNYKVHFFFNFIIILLILKSCFFNHGMFEIIM